MSLKIHHHSENSSILQIFLLTSFFYIYIAHSLLNQNSPFDTSSFVFFLKQYLSFFIITLIFNVVLFFKRRGTFIFLQLISLYYYLFFIIQISGNFNRVIILMFLIYLVISIIFNLMWFHETKLSAYNPMVNNHDISPMPQITISVEIYPFSSLQVTTEEFNKNSITNDNHDKRKIQTTENKEISLNPLSVPITTGVLSNWDLKSAFILLDNNYRPSFDKKFVIKINFLNNTYLDFAFHASTHFDFKGIGIVFVDSKRIKSRNINALNVMYSWATLIQTLTRMSYLPGYWK